MIENIKSSFIIENISKYINKRDILNIFRYNKLFQAKLGFTKNDYLYEYCNKIPEIKLMISKKRYEERNGERGVIKLLNSLDNDILNKKILKENIIEYLALREDFCLSIDHIFFMQIIKKKIELGIKNIKIKFYLEEQFFYSDYILDIIDHRKNNKIDKQEERYIKHIIKFINKYIKKLELLLNNNIPISELYFKLEDIEQEYAHDIIDYKYDLIKSEDKENNDIENIIINFKSKRVKLIRKIFEKNYKNITKMDYFVFYKNDKFVFPLVELEKFENLAHLNLGIFYEDSEKELIYNLPNELNKINKLKSLKIKRLNYHGNINVNIKREILDKLDILKIKEVNWIIEDKESFHLKNIKEFHYKIHKFPKKYIDHKNYFFKEFLKGNVSWEKLDKLKITSPFTDLEDIIKNNDEYWINDEIIVFFKNADIREGYGYEKSTSIFFQYFFNFILHFQNIHIKTKKSCKNIEEFILKIYDSDYFAGNSYQRDKIVYERKRKNANLEIGPMLLGCDANIESPLQYLNLDSIIIDPSLDSFTMNGFTINELKYLKEFISEQLKIKEAIYEKYKNIEKELESNCDNNKIDNILFNLRKDSKLISNKIKSFEKNNESYFEKTISKIKKEHLNIEFNIINDLIKEIKYNYSDDKKSTNTDEDTDLNINDINDNQIFFQ